MAKPVSTFLGMSYAAWAATAIAASAAMSYSASRNNAKNMKNAYRWQKKRREEKRLADEIKAKKMIILADENKRVKMMASGIEAGTGSSLIRISENFKKGDELIELIRLGAEMDMEDMGYMLQGSLGKEMYNRRVGIAQGAGQSLLTYGTFPR